MKNGADMTVVILCGGKGSRLREGTVTRPKPMIEVGEMPILWHIMKTYAHWGYRHFVLCLGYKGHVIKEYFYHYGILTNDFTVDLGSRDMAIHPRHSEDWRVTLVDTGQETMTGARVKRVEKYVESDPFLLTYGDGVTDLNIRALVEFHEKHGKIGTVTGVFPPSRYGELLIRGEKVLGFEEKPESGGNSINGGYFVLSRSFFKYLSDREDCVLEHEPLRNLAADGQLQVFAHKGFWQCMDTHRDYQYLNQLWGEGAAAWKVWDD
jgi:glucose-1-phosphate cytidylyltransferase